MSVDFFKQLFGQGTIPPHEVIEGPVPKDAKIRDCRFDGYAEGGIIELLLESSEFDDVEEGKQFPELITVMREIEPAK